MFELMKYILIGLRNCSIEHLLRLVIALVRLVIALVRLVIALVRLVIALVVYHYTVRALLQ